MAQGYVSILQTTVNCLYRRGGGGLRKYRTFVDFIGITDYPSHQSASILTI